MTNSTNKKAILAGLLLSMALLTACSKTASTRQVTSSSTQTSAVSQSSAVTASSQATSTAASSTTSASTTQLTAQQAELVGQYFTEKDLDASYDQAKSASIELSGTSAQVYGQGVSVEGQTVLISQAGTYVISGQAQGVQIKVAAGDEDEVQLVLNGVTLTGEDATIHTETAKKVYLTLAEGTTNRLADAENSSESALGATIYAETDLTLNGRGHLEVTGAAKNAIKSKDDLIITGGTYTVTAAKHALSANDALNITQATLNLTSQEDAIHSDNEKDASLGNLYIHSGDITINAGDDAIHASNDLVIDGGNIDIQSSVEGIEGKLVTINGGTIKIESSDDGINASDWAYTGDEFAAQEGVEIIINGGDISINMAAGDTDALDSNGNLTVNGGTLTINAQSAFDFNGVSSYTGGTLMVNGEQVTEITESMMMGPGGGHPGAGTSPKGGAPGGLGGR